MKRGNHVQYQQNAVGETIRRLRMEKNMPQELLSGAMLLSRGVSFYLFLLIGALVTGAAFLSSPAAHLSLQRPLGER